MPQPLGYVVFRGASRIDGAPIVAILTLKSDNRKTGDMCQLWIVREDLPPVEAIRRGADVSICGGCPHRGDGGGKRRSCYVNVGQAPASVWRAYKAGRYVDIISGDLAAIAALGEGRSIRLGAYGDPAAVPGGIVLALVSRARLRTGYTHQWRSRRLAGHLRGVVMASCDSVRDTQRASSEGWGTFSVVPRRETRIAGVTDVPLSGVQCASDRLGLTCVECGACDGRATNVWIHAHGSGAVHVDRRVLPVLA